MSGSIYCILAVPSIITNTGSVGGSIEITNNTLSGTLLFSGKNLRKASNFNPNISVYCGASLPTNNTSGSLITMMTDLKNAYSGSDVSGISNNVNTLLNTSGTSALTNLAGTMGVGILIGNSTPSTPVELPVNGTCGSINGTTPSQTICAFEYYSVFGPCTTTGATTCTTANPEAKMFCSGQLSATCICTTTSPTPSINLCSTGNPGTLSGTGPWSWICMGQHTGTNASCGASSSTAVCGTNYGICNVGVSDKYTTDA